jgi:hypothetical protein
LSLFRRRRDVEIRLLLPALPNLFVPPDLSPFSPDYETYGDRSGVDVVVTRLKNESLRSRFRAVVELPAEEIKPGIEQLTAAAIQRYCRVKLAGVDRDLREVTRHGIRALFVGLVAVLVVNGVARPLERSDDTILQLLAEGLQVTSWVILWVPISLLVYDRWYYNRDRKVYKRLQDIEFEVVGRH